MHPLLDLVPTSSFGSRNNIVQSRLFNELNVLRSTLQNVDSGEIDGREGIGTHILYASDNYEKLLLDKRMSLIGLCKGAASICNLHSAEVVQFSDHGSKYKRTSEIETG